MSRRWYLLVTIAAIAVATAFSSAGESKPADAGAPLLDTSSYWRCLFVHSPPVVRKGDKIESLEPGIKRRSVALPAGWTEPDFADKAWLRRPGPFFSPPLGFGSPDLSLIRMRGYFDVPDTAKAAGTRLSISYRGGVVLYLNGKDLARGSLPTGTVQPDTLAEDYPLETFFADDTCTKGISWGYGDPEKFKSRLAKRIRSLERIEIPVSMLRAGLNVLAVEIHRAAVPEAWTRLTLR